MKKFFSKSGLLCAAGLLAGSLLSAAPKSVPAKYAVNAPIEIVWWHALENQYADLVNEVVDNFNKSQDKITVKAEYIGNYAAVNQALVAAQAAGSGLPAVVVANTPYVAQYGASGLCEDLTPYIKATGFDLNDFGEGMIKASSYNKKQVSLPFLISTQVMYYNKDMAKKEGRGDSVTVQGYGSVPVKSVRGKRRQY